MLRDYVEEYMLTMPRRDAPELQMTEFGSEVKVYMIPTGELEFRIKRSMNADQAARFAKWILSIVE